MRLSLPTLALAASLGCVARQQQAVRQPAVSGSTSHICPPPPAEEYNPAHVRGNCTARVSGIRRAGPEIQTRDVAGYVDMEVCLSDPQQGSRMTAVEVRTDSRPISLERDIRSRYCYLQSDVPTQFNPQGCARVTVTSYFPNNARGQFGQPGTGDSNVFAIYPHGTYYPGVCYVGFPMGDVPRLPEDSNPHPQL